MPRKFMPVKAKQRRKIGDTNWLIDTLTLVDHGDNNQRNDNRNNSNDYYLFDKSPKTTASRLLKKYPDIFYLRIALNVNFKSLHANKTTSISVLTLKFSKLGNHITPKSCFKQFYENKVFFERYNKNCFRSATCYSPQHDKLL